MNNEMSYANDQGTLQLHVALVTPNTFQFLGVNPFLGRSIISEDAKSAAPPVFAMNYRLWQKHFNRDPKIVGTSFVIGGVSRTLVAVMPPRFQIDTEGSDLWIPSNPSPSDSGMSMNAAEPMHLWWPLGRLRPGLSSKAASADLNVVARRLAKAFPALYPPQFTMVTRPFVDVVVGNFRTMLYALAAAVAMLLLITCTNVANLLLARATTREKEMAIRVSIGASRGRLVRQVLIESIVLAVAGAMAGCLFAYWGLKGFLTMLPGGTLPEE
jgi:putative ABC transport system permease protein